MKNHKFSTPNLKLRIKNVRYTFCGATVHCFITPEPMNRRDPYTYLLETANLLGMKYGVHTQFTCANYDYHYIGEIPSNSDKYIYNPTAYEYHGMVSLKSGDASDIELAKKIAYQKAYRQFVNFYYNCYYNLYDYVMAYARDVWYEQMAQLSDRWEDSNGRICYMVNPPGFSIEAD